MAEEGKSGGKGDREKILKEYSRGEYALLTEGQKKKNLESTSVRNHTKKAK